MKAQQLEALRGRHQDNLNARAKPRKAPDAEQAVRLALVNGEVLRMRSPAEILSRAKCMLAADGYGKVFTCSDIFKPSDGFERSLSVWLVEAEAEAERYRVYMAAAEPLLMKAVLDDAASAVEIGEALATAALLLIPPAKKERGA